MFGASYKIATVWGIPIKIHVSLLLMVLFFVRRFGLTNGILLEFCVMTSIVLHELGHSFVAIKKGCRVRQITLMFLGGAAQMEQIPRRPRDEFLMAIAGPSVSLAVGLVCTFGGRYLPLPLVYDYLEQAYYPLNFVQLIGILNLGLLIFNLLPSFPMDGGRVVRAALTPRLGRLRATFIAARLGQIMAILFAVHGFLSGQWILVFIAFFVYTTARNEYRMVQMEEAMKQGGGGGFRIWPSFAGPGAGSDHDEQATVSPPPYRRGPDSKINIHHD